MSQYQHLRVDRDPRDVVVVLIDCAGRSMNVFDSSLLDEIENVIETIASDPSVRMVVFRSGKKSGFFAGADLHQIQNIHTPEQAATVLRRGQELFNRVESLQVPTLAVIHGPCLGGGLEFSLACKYRVARDDSTTKIGLPETQLGLIPAWGGTQRLPKVVGLTTAISMILQGSRLSASKAKRIGLVDAVLNKELMESELDKFVDRCLQNSVETERSQSWGGWLHDRTWLGKKLVFKIAERKIANKSRHYPALPAALRAIRTGHEQGMTAGLAAERDEFSRVLFTPACRNLLDLFFRRERARELSTWVSGDVQSTMPIGTIGVLGAGTMGAGIAQLTATQGFQVILKEIDEVALRDGSRRIEQLTRQAVQKGALDATVAEAAIASITKTTQSAPLRNADLVIEAVVERLDVKQKVFQELEEHLPSESLLASNTSALSISEIAATTEHPNRVAGLHFFNPVHKMPLVEIVRGSQTSDSTVACLCDCVRKLGKTPIVVNEGPGFLVNRTLFPYLDEAVRLVSEGVSVETIDREAKRFGLPMGPLELLDTIGLDIALDVSKTLAALSLEESPTPQFLLTMVERDQLGQKTGRGFYHYKNGRRKNPVDFESHTTGTPKLSPVELADETLSGVQQRLVFSMLNAAADCLHDHIVSEPWMVDLGMVIGTGFPPFRGGPMTLIEHWGRESVIESMQELSEVCGPRFRPSEFFDQPEVKRDSTNDQPAPIPHATSEMS